LTAEWKNKRQINQMAIVKKFLWQRRAGREFAGLRRL
jgi:hypothetical protein